MLLTLAEQPPHTLTREQSSGRRSSREAETAAPRRRPTKNAACFPGSESADPGARKVLDTMLCLERDHEIADAHHRAVDQLWRRRLALEELPPLEMRELRDRLGVLHAIYKEHILVEDGELFPVAARVLSRADIEAIGLEMASRRREIE